ncbi:MAG TPA: DEAD/DEAH box helicase [Anaerolineaceae bacterium]|nr:DEAD/DEAH box helicase [Anaerolineaceae bacterium]HPN54234.1 DEAD/DEAH box helicase [Anaerolineaceae bacterium]
MQILHAHFSPELSGLVFWVESPDCPAPKPQRGRVAENPKPKTHPFCIVPDFPGEIRRITLRLPAVKGIPLPSPQLIHNWTLDTDQPGLASFLVDGLFYPPEAALVVLLAFSTVQDGASGIYQAAPTLRFWRLAAGLVLETLAGQKIIPALIKGEARWLPVLDTPRDAARLAQLAAAMPPVCRAGNPDLSARQILTSFINTFCDALARSWGRSAAPRLPRLHEAPVYRWLEALFTPAATFKLPASQLDSLTGSHQAWMRNLHVAGDAAFRVAFRLEAPVEAAAPWLLYYLIQSKEDPSLLIPADEVWKNTRGTLMHLGQRFEQPQEKLLAGLGYASRLFPPIAESLKGKRPTELTVDAGGAYAFLRDTAPILEGAGFGILVPPWWNKKGARLGVKVKMKSKKDQAAPGQMTLDRLVDYRWQLSIGETELTEAEFRALAKLKSPLVQIRGQWVCLEAGQIDAAIKFWEKQKTEGEIGLLEAMRLGLEEETQLGGLPVDEIEMDGWLKDWLERFTQAGKLEMLTPPAGLQAQLRPYQVYGYSWLAFLRHWGLGACLADDMGLGKTIQTISLLLREKEAAGKLPAPALLIAPTSVVTNWEREIGRFAPGLNTYVHRGNTRLRTQEFQEAIREVDVVLTSYPVARLDAETLQAVHWLAVILDEAQNIKNPDTKQTQMIRKIDSDFRIALTGTPVENRLSELWSIMHFLNPGYLGGRQAFRQEFALPIERYNDAAALEQLKKLTGPFILRRVKTDQRVISDLPEKVETRVYCTLTEEQATLYEAVVQDAMKQIEGEEGIKRRGLVLSMLMQLKQICNHPVQYLHQARKGAEAEAVLAQRSGKLERLGEMLEEVLAEGDRCLIFTQFAEMGQLLAGYLPHAFGAATQFLHGETPAKMRDQMVKRFQEDEHAPPVFILSLKAGGTGLNLTRASHVFHFDRWWNPAVEDQATDRAFRIGQSRRVQVHKFVTTGTLEEMIDDMIENKKGLAQSVVGTGENWMAEMSTDQLRDVVRLRR